MGLIHVQPLLLLALLRCAVATLSPSVRVGKHKATVVLTEFGPFETIAKELPDGAEFGQNPKVDLAVKHMSKMGGSFLINLLNDMTTEFPREKGQLYFARYFEEYPSNENMFLKLRHKYFVIAGVRNPCNWYISQWAFASKFDNQTLYQKYGHDFFGDLQDPVKFREWLLWAQGMAGKQNMQEWLENHQGPHPGTLSIRFWESFIGGRSDYVPPSGVKPAELKNPVYDTTLLDGFTRSYDGRSDVDEAVKAFRPVEHADCWVRQETYEADLRFCLAAYEKVAGAELEWLPFEHNFGRKESVVSTNPSKHASCSSYYTPELAAVVQEVDKGLFDAFHYPTCCGKAEGSPLVYKM